VVHRVHTQEAHERKNRKPAATRRHDSLADGAFGQENPPHLKMEQQRNLKISGQPSTQHSKYKRNPKGESK
jgi:hypothetical protein